MSLEQEASDNPSLERCLWNRSTPAGRLPPEMLEHIIAMQASEQDLLNASRVCRSWRDILPSSPSLWTEFTCKGVLKTLEYLGAAPIDVIACCKPGVSIDIEAVIALKSATERFRFLTLQLEPSELSRVLGELVDPAPILEHLRLSLPRPEHGSGSIPENFLGGSTPSLKSMHLCDINTGIFFSEFPLLTRLILTTNTETFDISQLFRVFTSAKLLEEVNVRFLGPTTVIPETQAVIDLLWMREFIFSTKHEESPKRLLSFLNMPSVRKVELSFHNVRKGIETMQDFLPPQLWTFPHLLKIHTLKLDVSDSDCWTQFCGPGGVVSVHVSPFYEERGDVLWQSHWLGFLVPMSIADIENITLNTSSLLETGARLFFLELLRTMNGVQDLTMERCNDKMIIGALSPSTEGGILFPHLKSLMFRLTPKGATVFPHLTDMSRARDQQSYPLGKVSSDESRTFRRSDVDSLKPHVSCVQLNTE